jgi:stage V sporulation protein R
MSKLLFKCGQDWTPAILRDTLECLTELAYKDLGLDLYPNQVFIVSAASMRDAYASVGMPHLYPHWSHAKRMKELEARERGLAFEMIIPTNPCTSWNMASNSVTMMALVLAHAAIGHNHFFKNNYLFREHTKAAGLADYCRTIHDAVHDFEKRYGIEEVESILDSIHALMLPTGVFRHGEPVPFDAAIERERVANYMRELERTFDPLMVETVSRLDEKIQRKPELKEKDIRLPQENILWFIEQHAPKLKGWQRELIRMVRNIAQQVYLPSVQTKFANEGTAMFCEWYLLKKLYEQGRLDDGTWLEMIDSNQGVLFQHKLYKRYWKDRRSSLGESANLNPYAFGFAMMKDIVRICGPKGEDAAFFHPHIDMNGPTDEERALFPAFAGTGNWRETFKDAIANYNDSSYILQFMSPRFIKDFGLMEIRDEGGEPDEDSHYKVTATQDHYYWEDVRYALSEQRSFEGMYPNIRIAKVDMDGNRKMSLVYKKRNGMELHEKDSNLTMTHLKNLWGYDAEIEAE